MSENKNTGLSVLISDAELLKAKELDQKLVAYQNSGLTGVARSVAKVKLINELNLALSTTGMLKEVMQLQGKKYGFLTDIVGYKEDIVKDCLMEAMIFGVEPTGNQFNIIAGKMYVTKEGCTQKLINMGVQYEILPGNSKVLENKMCVVPMTIKWVTKEGVSGTKSMDVGVNGSEKVAEPARQGQANRDIKAWLIEYLTGNPISVGEASENIVMLKEKPQTNSNIQEAEVIVDEPTPLQSSEADTEKVDDDQKRGIDYLNKSKDLADLEKRYKAAMEVDRGTGCIERAYQKQKEKLGTE